MNKSRRMQQLNEIKDPQDDSKPMQPPVPCSVLDFSAPLRAGASVNKAAIAKAFGKAAAHYDQFADIQRQAGRQLMAMLEQRAFRQILDAGCGTGIFSRHWRGQGGIVTALDLSAAMLAQARKKQAAEHYLLADIEQLPLAAGQFDLCWSNLALQWCGDLCRGLGQLWRVTSPGGWLAVSTLAQGSLAELHQAWQAVDSHLHGNLYPPAEHIISASPHPAMRWQQRAVTLYFADAISAMRSVKGVGATHLQQGRANCQLSRQQLQQVSLSWQRQQGQFPLTYQLMLGVAQRPL